MAAQPWPAGADRAARLGRVTDTKIAGPGAGPLSVAQEALWYQTLLAPNQVSYNETISIQEVQLRFLRLMGPEAGGQISRHGPSPVTDIFLTHSLAILLLEEVFKKHQR